MSKYTDKPNTVLQSRQHKFSKYEADYFIHHDGWSLFVNFL